MLPTPGLNRPQGHRDPPPLPGEANNPIELFSDDEDSAAELRAVQADSEIGRLRRVRLRPNKRVITDFSTCTDYESPLQRGEDQANE